MGATPLSYTYYTPIIGAQSSERAEQLNKCEWEQRLEEEERGVCGNVKGGQEGRKDDQERGKDSLKFQPICSQVLENLSDLISVSAKCLG